MDADVAVVVPTYNRLDYLPITLEAILNQTEPPCEVVVVDDGGTADLAPLRERFAGRVKFLRVPNGGPSLARNAGIITTSSPWVALCDDDDFWKPTHLETLRRATQTYPTAEFLFTNFAHVVEGVWAEITKFDQAPAGYWSRATETAGPHRYYASGFYEEALGYQPIFPSASFFRRSLFDRVGGYTPALSRLRCEDWEFTLKAIDGTPVLAISDATVGIRKHAGNFSGCTQEVVQAQVMILQYALAHHPGAAAYRNVVEAEIASRSRDAAELAFTNGQFATALAMLKNVPPSYWHARLRAKSLIAGLPGPVARLLKKLVTRE